MPNTERPPQASQWYNEPPVWQADGQSLTVTCAPNTDFWRRTHYGFIRDSGHFYYQSVAGDFQAQVRLVGQYKDLYDQAGLMVRLSHTHWLKCGIEFVEGVQQVSAVVTREFSDWSVAPLADHPPALWLRLSRRAETIEVSYSRDGADFTLLRLAFFDPAESVQVGLMCCSPDGAGFTVRFEDYALVSLKE